jgi:hypothetical protein
MHRRPAEETLAEWGPVVRAHTSDGVETILHTGEENTLALVGPFDHLPPRESLARNTYGQVRSI